MAFTGTIVASVSGAVSQMYVNILSFQMLWLAADSVYEGTS